MPKVFLYGGWNIDWDWQTILPKRHLVITTIFLYIISERIVVKRKENLKKIVEFIFLISIFIKFLEFFH